MPRSVDLPSSSSSDVKKLITKKNKEIETLNAECLELEDLCASLKKEVQDAWDSYKQAQEKAAIVEDELQEEIKTLQKARQLEKQALNTQIAELSHELESFVKRVEAAEEDRDEAIKALEDRKDLEKQSQLMQLNSNFDKQSLFEELQIAKESMESLRAEHASLLRSHQSRQEDLESMNAKLTLHLAEKDAQISRLQLLSKNPRDNENIAGLTQLNNQLQDELSQAKETLKDERARIIQLDRYVSFP